MAKGISLVVNMVKRKLKTQLALVYSLLIVIIIACISTLATIVMNETFENYIKQAQTIKKDELIHNISQQYDATTQRWQMDGIHTIGMYALNEGFIIQLSDFSGTRIWDAKNHNMEKCKQIMQTIDQRMEQSSLRDGHFTTKQYPIKQGEQTIATLSIQFYGPFFLSENDFQFIQSLNTITFAIAAIAIVLAIMISFLLAKKICSPISETIALVNNIAKGDYAIKQQEQAQTIELQELLTSAKSLCKTLQENEILRQQQSADIAHELRTPLTTLSTHIEAMMEGVWQPTQERLQSCQEEIERIIMIVKDIECLYDFENNHLTLQKENIDLYTLVQKITTNYAIAMHNKQIQLHLSGRNCMVWIDRHRMSQVIINLLINAIKYTPENGCIDIRITQDKEYTYLQMQDTGEGIPNEDIPYIFDRFYRCDKSRTRQSGGAGIGLAIVKQVVLLHGGSLHVKSELAKGSCFTIQIPNKKNTQ